MKPRRGAFRANLRSSVFLLLVSMVLHPLLFAQLPELRGVWMTPRSGSGFWSKADIARAMDSVAESNFNIVYFNAWSRGWPLWRSEVFLEETGYATDPAAGGRDILQEAIAEAHRRGLEIEPWMEYGFVGWWSGNSLPGFPKGPLFARHPDWLARNQSGSDEFPSGHVGVFYWMSHNHPEVQAFLVRLHTEIARLYDVDGIELDRIRYPQLNCGYDSASVALYQQEIGSPPPANFSDPGWMRWRADRLTAFHRAVYDSIKAANPYLTVSNAPSHYSSSAYYPAYENFLQDWRAWINGGSLDAAQIQMYVRPSILQQYIASALLGLQDSLKKKAYAGIAVRTSDYTATPEEAVELVNVVRDGGLQGSALWYYNDMIDLGYLGILKSHVYGAKVPLPYRDIGWREGGRILDEDGGIGTNGWQPVTLQPGSQILAWNRTFAYVGAGTSEFYEYRLFVPATAYYEVYAHQVGGLLNLTSQAPYELFGSDGTRETVVVDQSQSAQVGWRKLGDLFLATGENQVVVRLTNENIGQGKFVVADALMLLRNRRLSPGVVAVKDPVASLEGQSESTWLTSYPNPFNSSARITYRVPNLGPIRLEVFDTLGRRVRTLVDEVLGAGSYSTELRSTDLSSGVYVVRLQTGRYLDARKVILLR